MIVGPGHARLSRRQVTATRASGKLVEWNAEGELSWIEPTTPIVHPTARKHAGRIFLREGDIDAKIEGVGSGVTFFVYADELGLGAMNCRPASGPDVAKTLVRPALTAVAVNAWEDFAGGLLSGAEDKTLPRQVVSNTPILGRVRRVRGSTGWIEPLEALPAEVQDLMTRGQIYMHRNDVEGEQEIVEGLEVLFCVYTDPHGLGAMSVTPTEAGLVAPPRVRKEKRPRQSEWRAWDKSKLDQRETLTLAKITGTVSDWRRTFGWIIPDEEVPHPAAGMHSGRIYIHREDLVGVDALEPGMEVSFHVYLDESGLGAAECALR
mmetsp:Transcript_10396/g.18675  ORF Transcript_10396/g.18675 Transcript_10396/m.18675 type:complete len:321 (-) Transcript_10396:11-973(-)